MSQILIRFPQTISWSVSDSGSSDCYIAECQSLGLVLEADSLDQIPGLIEEALDALFDSLVSEGDFDQFFVDRGWPEDQRPTARIVRDTPVRAQVTKPNVPHDQWGMQFQCPPELIVQANRAHA